MQRNENQCSKCVFYDMQDELEGLCGKMAPKTEPKQHKDASIVIRKDQKKLRHGDDWPSFFEMMDRTAITVSHNFGCVHFEFDTIHEHSKD